MPIIPWAGDTATCRFFSLPSATAALLLTLGSAVISAPVLAQTNSEQSRQLQSFDLPADRLASTLSRIAAQTGTVLVFDPAQLDGFTNAAVSGRYTVIGLIEQLISDTGLVLSYSPQGSMMLVPSEQEDGTINLSAIQVTGLQPLENVQGPVDGYLALRTGSVGKLAAGQLETARSVSVVTADQIDDMAVTSVEEAVSYTAGVQASAYGQDLRFDQISVRGYDVVSAADYRDGLRQAYSGWLSMYRTEPFGLERLEIVKGPDSVSYGQVTAGGLINRVTKRPGMDSDNVVTLQLGSEQHRQGQLDVSGMATDTLDYRLVALARDADSDVVGINDDSLYLAPSVHWQLTDNTDLTLLYHHQTYETAGSPQLYQDGDTLTNFWAGDIDYDKMHQSQNQITSELNHRFNQQWSFHQIMRFGNINSLNRYADSTGEVDGTEIERYSAEIVESLHTFGMDNQLRWRQQSENADYQLVVGIDHYRINANIDYKMGDAPSIDRTNPDYHQAFPARYSIYKEGQHSRQTGAYVQSLMTFDEVWHLTVGVRRDTLYTHTDDLTYGGQTLQDDQAQSGSLGLSYEFSNGLAPYASYATSFSANIGTDADGQPFDPSRGRQLEAGVKYLSNDQRWFAVASLFNLTESQVLTTDPDNTDFSVQTGEQRIRGLELEGKASTGPLDLTASYTHLDPEITSSNDGTEGNQPEGIPNNMANIWGNYEAGRWQAGLGLRWVGMTYADSDNSVKNDAYQVVDARASWSLEQWLAGAKAALNVSNLTDNTYTLCHEGYCYQARGRKTVASLTYQW